MKLKNILPLIVALTLRAAPLLADAPSGVEVLKDVKALIEDAYYTDNKNTLLVQIPRLHPLTEQDSLRWHAHYYLAFCHNHLAMICMKLQEDEEAQVHVEEAFKQMDLAAEIRDCAELYVMRISSMGKKIELGSSFLRMTRGLETLRYMDKARQMDPNAPGVVFEDALTTYHTPRKFGGGVDKAKRLLLKNLSTLETYEKEDPLLLDWHTHADTLAWLAHMEIEEGNLEKAAQYMEKVRIYQPKHAFLHKVVEVRFKAKQSEILQTAQETERGRHG